MVYKTYITTKCHRVRVDVYIKICTLYVQLHKQFLMMPLDWDCDCYRSRTRGEQALGKLPFLDGKAVATM